MAFNYFKATKQCGILDKSDSGTSFDQSQYLLNRSMAAIRLNLTDGNIETNISNIARYKGIQIHKAQLQISDQIGRGCYGDVYFSSLNGTVVAAKVMRDGLVSKLRTSLVMQEFKEMCQLRHQNLVQYISTYVDGDTIGVVMEYMQMSLYEATYLRDDISFTNSDKVHIIRQVCNGLEYLHNSNLAQCNLKTKNVLLHLSVGNAQVKLTDFGLSLVGYSDGENSEMLRHVSVSRFSAPEVVRGELLVMGDMMKADVYSAALIVYSIVFGIEPYTDKSMSEVRPLILNGHLPETRVGRTLVPEVLKAMTSALHYHPDQRLTMPEMNQVFGRIQNPFVR